MAASSSLLDLAGGLRREEADGSLVFLGAALRIRLVTLKPGFVLVTADGEALGERDGQAELALTTELDRELERAGTLTVFADLRQSPRMPAKSRDMIARWTRRHQARLNASHVLVHSKFMELAMSIVAMLVGGGMVKVYSKPDVFLNLVRKVAPRLTELPCVPAANTL